ncbi:MAG: tRNA preQ1(34) S-adenosylmethionine ribosyltransferase-isomerase QueA [Alphaproteobacteria bacterium]
MRVDVFDYELSEDRIALRPVQPRDAARMLVVRGNGGREHRLVRDLPDLLCAGDALVVNDTKVIPARFQAHRGARDGMGAGASIEVTLHKRIAPGRFLAFARPAKRLKEGDLVRLSEGFAAKVERRSEGEIELSFSVSGHALDAAIARHGKMPLPPYIASRRTPDSRDTDDYQTIYAEKPGSVAAPTAGLHFTDALLARLREKGFGVHDVTLSVGAGTFLPVTADDTDLHKMHAEWASLTESTADALNAVRGRGGNVVAVGTTALRTLESAADEGGRLHPFNGETDLFITPGYPFKAVDVLLTNFHLPRSTLFILVCAFSGIDTMKAAYADAASQGYRFYSYGDACLLFRRR